MRRFRYVAGAVLAALAVEIAAFVAVVRLVGLGWAVLLGLTTSVLGGWLLRREGARGLRRFREAAQQKRPPGREATDGLVGLIGALLLVVPGFVTDLIGALLVVPPLRWFARNRIERGAERFITPTAAGSFFGPRRARAGHPVPDPQAAPPSAGPQPWPAQQPTRPLVLEGEIIEPDRRSDPGS